MWLPGQVVLAPGDRSLSCPPMTLWKECRMLEAGRSRCGLHRSRIPLGEGPCPRPQFSASRLVTPLSPLSCDIALRLSPGMLPATVFMIERVHKTLSATLCCVLDIQHYGKKEHHPTVRASCRTIEAINITYFVRVAGTSPLANTTWLRRCRKHVCIHLLCTAPCLTAETTCPALGASTGQ